SGLLARINWIRCYRSRNGACRCSTRSRSPMKLFCVGVVSLFTISVATAQEQSSSTIRPQPRLRLDPARQAAVTVPVAAPVETAGSAEVPVHVLDRLVVKDSAIFRQRPPTVEDPVGKFSPLSGGRLLR